VPQLGTVIIESHVEIGANTTIDRGALENTVIGQGTKIDNQVQLGHNVRIGKNTIIAGCAGIAGSTQIGDNCMIGGAACINGHIKITDNVSVAAMTGIAKSIDEAGVYCSGIKADRREIWRKNAYLFGHLNEMAEKIKFLEQQLNSSNINND